MRFLLGLLIGIGLGFVVAILFAPERKKRAEWYPPGMEPPAANGSRNGAGALEELRAALRDRLSTATNEAKKAHNDAEQEMVERYERAVGRKMKS
jgi:gas vesicle protein